MKPSRSDEGRLAVLTTDLQIKLYQGLGPRPVTIHQIDLGTTDQLRAVQLSSCFQPSLYLVNLIDRLVLADLRSARSSVLVDGYR